jgi:O-antigen ligase
MMAAGTIDRPSPVRPAAVIATAASRMPAPLVRAAFYLFVFSIPFELPMRDLPLDVPRIAAGVFLVATLLDLAACYRRVPWVLPLFGAYLWVYATSFLINGGQYPAEVLRLFLQFVQVVLLFWAASHLLRVPRVFRQTMIAFAAACVLRAAVQVFRLPVLATAAERATAFGQNANQGAMVLAAGTLVLIGLQFGRAPWLRPRLLAWPLLALLGIALFETGSRGGMAALAVGLVVFFAGASGVHRLRALVVLVVALGSFYFAAANSDFMQKRVLLAEQGNLAGRELIYPALVGMWTEKPVIGWGPVTNKYELGERLAEPVRRRRGTHNLALDVLTSTGIVGAAFYFTAVALCFGAAWRGRRGWQGPLPLALLATLLVTNLSGEWPVAPVWWLALALGAASGAAPLPRRHEPLSS